ncbi:MAG TPA: hypothetical protein PKE21_13820 [Flavobacteriales bacterium]|nr:hypothetical protein [Flavobacteriales bacterium]HMR28555.1 hypothetical protein [Flavobacteriales bacterium]
MQQLKRLFNDVWKRLLANWQELIGLPIALVLFFASGVALRVLEPRSALYDAGVLQGIAVVLVHLLVANSLARFATRVNLAWFYEGKSYNRNDRVWLFIAYLAAYCLLALSL